MLWELMEPCPPPEPGDYTNDPRYKRALQTIGTMSFNIVEWDRVENTVVQSDSIRVDLG